MKTEEINKFDCFKFLFMFLRTNREGRFKRRAAGLCIDPLTYTQLYSCTVLDEESEFTFTFPQKSTDNIFQNVGNKVYSQECNAS